MPKVCPVMYPACLEQRNAHAAPTSSASPSLFIGARSSIAPTSPSRRNASVRIASGAMQLTVIRSAATSADSDFANPVTAARSELERTRLGIGCRTEIDVTTTMRPWQRDLDEPDHAHQDEIERPLPALDRQGLHDSRLRPPRVGDEDVQSAEAFNSRLHKSLRLPRP